MSKTSGFGRVGRWPGAKRKPSTTVVTPLVPDQPVGYVETNLSLPGMAVNEFSGLPFGSGSSGQQTPALAFAKWRGRSDDIYGTHSDNNQDAEELWWARFTDYTAAPNWNKHIDVSIGLFGKDYNGPLVQETWKGAGRGDYDARWIRTLQNARTRLHSRIAPNGKPIKVFIRPAHEANGNWYPWSFSNYWLRTPSMNGLTREVSNMDDVVAGYKRFYDLAKIHYPEAYIVINFNRTGEGFSAWDADATGPAFSGNWRDVAIRLGPAMDLYGVDYYNWYPAIHTAAQFTASLNALHSYDSPKGLNTHKSLAVALGKPMCFSEWGCVSTAPGETEPTPSQVAGGSSPGDSPEFLKGMYEWFVANAGIGAGQVVYECYWNVLMAGGDQSGPSDDKFHLYHIPGTVPLQWYHNGIEPLVTKMDRAARYYRRRWSTGGTIPLEIEAGPAAPQEPLPPPSTSQPTGPAGSWALVFSDEFPGTSVDPAKWVVANGQYQQNNMTPRPANVVVADSMVKLRLGVVGADAGSTEGAQMHSGIHNGLNRQDGSGYRAPVGSYVEARVWFNGDGVKNLDNWPATWTCGEGWPVAGEHDFAEVLEFDATTGAKVYGVYHYSPTGQFGAHQGTGVYGPVAGYLGEAWHTYGVHRKSTSADYYLDGALVGTVATSDTNLPHAIILTMGRRSSGTPVTGENGEMRVDWVRSWHPAAA